MRRHALTTAVLAGLAAWASAQGPAPGETAAERMDQFTRDRALLETLVDRGLELADAGTPLRRARVCHDAATDIGGRLREAVAAEDPVRVAELTEYLGAIVHDGLVPTYRQARDTIPPGSPEAADLDRLRYDATAGLDRALDPADAARADGRIGTSARIRDARRHLAAARGLLEQSK